MTVTTARSLAGAKPAQIAGWGGGPPAPVMLSSPATVDQLQDAVSSATIARGMGRSYGDAAQLRDGVVIDMTRLDAVELDADRGEVTAQAGATLGALLALLEPAGWVLPVVPGTQHVTVAGAIASDIHGKNHATAGTFGSHVSELGLLTASGEVLTLTPVDDLFGATLGGMGLTGIIVWARVRLRRLPRASLTVDTDRVQSLDEALTILDGPGGVHRVAWLDLLSRRPVRGIVTRADPASVDSGDARTTVVARLAVPSRWRRNALTPGLVRRFNELRFHRSPRRARGQIESFGAHMFPLDALDAWPRLYGPGGFVQYQLVVPRGQEQALQELLGQLRRSRVPCYLAVLKDFGPANGAPLSFPLLGWTLALDLPRSAPGLEPLLRCFDELVAGAGGRVYLAKDGRLEADVLAAMYPRLPEWRAIRDLTDPEQRWRSDLGVRTGLVDVDR
jgi:decaprenylphospho-beta-D-ribofuranose 2-oxidase